MDTALTNKPASGEEKNWGMVGQCYFLGGDGVKREGQNVTFDSLLAELVYSSVHSTATQLKNWRGRRKIIIVALSPKANRLPRPLEKGKQRIK